jgi:hypothetical protein
VPTNARRKKQAVDRASIARDRIANQIVGGRRALRVADIVAHLGAVQAQDFLGALWALGLRSERATERAVEQAIANREIVRTWPMRGTLHFVPANDARWMLALLTPRVIARNANRYRELELTPAVFAQARAVAEQALGSAGRLTRTALYTRFEAAGIATAGARGLHILGFLAQQGVICFGPREGKQPTFVLLDEWISSPRRLSKEESLGELARRYFASHGPATLHDFVWWSGLPVGDARIAIDMNDAALRRDLVDGTTHLCLGRTRGGLASKTGVHLLPPYDELIVGYRDRDAVVHPEFVRRVGAWGVMWPTILLGDRIVGNWKRELTRGTVRMHLQPFIRLGPPSRKLVEAAARRYAAFLELPLEIRWSAGV